MKNNSLQGLHIDSTKDTPSIDFRTSGILSIMGKSYSDNIFNFYEPVVAWIERYFNENKSQETTINIQLVYFNSGSRKVLSDIFHIFEKNMKNCEIIINWFYDEENETAIESQKDFKANFPELNIRLLLAD